MARADPRTTNWLLIKEPWSTILLVSAYLLIVLIGPVLMKRREAMDLKQVMFIYNFCLVMLNAYITVEIILSVIESKYNWLCDTLDYHDNGPGNRLAAALWWFYFSKIIEFIDTFIFILRKKNNQISFLHVYHHSTMPLLWWIGIRWFAGGVSFFSALINSMVHIIMYTYYFLAAFGDTLKPYLGWKRYLTMIQLGQFCLVLIHTVQALFITACDFDWRTEVALIFYLLSHIILFSNFYKKTYKKPKTN